MPLVIYNAHIFSSICYEHIPLEHMLSIGSLSEHMLDYYHYMMHLHTYVKSASILGRFGSASAGSMASSGSGRSALRLGEVVGLPAGGVVLPIELPSLNGLQE